MNHSTAVVVFAAIGIYVTVMAVAFGGAWLLYRTLMAHAERRAHRRYEQTRGAMPPDRN